MRDTTRTRTWDTGAAGFGRSTMGMQDVNGRWAETRETGIGHGRTRGAQALEYGVVDRRVHADAEAT